MFVKLKNISQIFTAGFENDSFNIIEFSAFN